MRSRKVFVGGLPFDLPKDEFAEYFSKFGEIEDAIIMLEKTSGHPRGFGFVTFTSETAIDAVLANYDGNYIRGKWVEVKVATPKDRDRDITLSPSTCASSPDIVEQYQEPSLDLEYEGRMEAEMMLNIEDMIGRILDDDEDIRPRRTTI
jgi:RNA recognition motif-containing protein